MKTLKPAEIMTHEERQAYGKSRREVVHRIDQAAWVLPSNRPDPVESLLAATKDRLPDLIPIKMGRMAASPFGFFRGAAPLMAADLATLPTTGLHVQICGDAHVRNLGAFAAPDGHLVFDLNDFDETVPGPWEWDLKRLATSLVLAGSEAGGNHGDWSDAVLALVSSYREAINNFSGMTMIDLARYEVRRRSKVACVRDVLAKAERATPTYNMHSRNLAVIPLSA